MRKSEKIKLIADQIIFYSEGKVIRPVAESEAEDYLRRKGLASVFVHESSYSSVGKKIAMKCMGKPIC